MTPEEIQKAKEIIKTEEEARAKKCWEAVQETLKAHNCNLAFGINIGGQSVPAHQILASEIIIHVIPQ